MPTYNLLETVHNVLFHQSKKKGTCLYTVILDDYVQAFKQQHCITILGRVVHQVKELIGVSFSFAKQPNQVTKATCKCNFEICTMFIFHNKNRTYGRQRDFWLLQREAQFALELEGDSHKHDHVNLSCPCVNINPSPLSFQRTTFHCKERKKKTQTQDDKAHDCCKQLGKTLSSKITILLRNLLTSCNSKFILGTKDKIGTQLLIKVFYNIIV